MADDRDPPIRLQLDLSADQPGLLEGLDSWLRLGLLSDQQVQAICQSQLSCDLPPQTAPDTAADFTPNGAANLSEESVLAEPVLAASVESPQEEIFAQATTPEAEPAITDFTPAAPPSRRAKTSPTRRASRPQSRSTTPPSRPTAPHWLNRLLSELSVVWLLGLGVFLVVLSSAVLAATQWANFNAAGQYLVLLAYTLVFWAAGLWCRRSPNLQLTAKTLQMITLLLVPLNFWAMDGLGIWNGAGLLVGAIAAILLTLAALQILRQQNSSTLEQASALGLAYLHTGWALAGVPLLAVYAGVVGTAAATVYDQRQRPVTPGLRWPTVVITAALGLLLVRGLTTGNPAGQFGLAFGLYGATLVWLGQRRLVPRPEPTPSSTGDLSPRVVPAGATETAESRPFRWGIAMGRSLLLWGWLLALSGWLWQAFGVSVLGLALRTQALSRLGKRRDLLIGYSIAVQLAFIGWEILPEGFRQSLLSLFTGWSGLGFDQWPLLGISLFPYVVAVVALGDWYRRRGNVKLSRFSDGMALGSNVMLTVFSLASGPVLVVNLIASAIASLVVTLRRPLARWRIVITYGLTLGATLIAIDQRWPGLVLDRWVVVILILATVALGLSKALPGLWGTSAWLYGVGLSALTYALLWAHLVNSGYRTGLSWVGLVIPLVLALIGRHPASVLTTGLALPLTLGLPWTRLVGLGTATVLTGFNSRAHRRPGVAFLAVGFALGWVYAGLADWLPAAPRQAPGWGLVTVGLMAGLWGLWRWLGARAELSPDAEMPSLAALYGVACDRWGHILTVGLLVLSTTLIGFYYLGWRSPTGLSVAVLGGLLLALGLRYWGDLRPTGLYLGGWGLELLVAALVVQRYPTVVALAVPTLGLGAIALALSAKWGRFPQGSLRESPLARPLQNLTLAYAALALALRLYTVTAWTGWLVVGASLLALDVGRRRPTPLLRWLALGGLSIGWYELVIYQMLQGSGGAAADALLVLAGVAALIMVVYRLAAGLLDRRLGLPSAELVWTAHLHWFIGSLLLLGGGLGLSFGQATLGVLGLGIAAAFLLYALAQGRLRGPDAIQQAWVYAGLGELIGWFALGRSLFPALAVLDNWWGVVACAVAVPVYWVPWATWGWPQRPWRAMAVGVPFAIALVTGGFDHIPTLWVLAGFYGWLAWHSGRIRLSYLSVLCAVWAVWVWLENQNLRDGLAWVMPLGLALIYIAQVDPALARPEGREQRHWLRVIALAMVLLTALFNDRWAGLPVGALALGAIAAGLLLRLRAPLYVGTLVFVLNTLNQLVLLNAAFPFIKWMVGIVVGIALIWIAADVERRRDQWLQLTQNWGQDLDNWQ